MPNDFDNSRSNARLVALQNKLEDADSTTTFSDEELTLLRVSTGALKQLQQAFDKRS
jgi:hypothetical protein